MITPKIVVTLSIVSVFMMTSANQSFAMGSANMQQGKGLYFYSGSELIRFLDKIGYSDYQPKSSYDIRRNAVGTELLFFNSFSKKRKALVVSCNGSIKEIDLPSSLIWLNDEYQALAWVDYKDWKVHYKNGHTENTPFMADNRADPSGIYFMKNIESSVTKGLSDGTAIYSIEAPEIELASIMKFDGLRIFSKNGKVIIFGDYFIERDRQPELYIFERRGRKLVQIEKVIISRPQHKYHSSFAIEDLSPWNDDALFVGGVDFPNRSMWYVYNIKTREMKKIGKKPFTGGYGFYLQCDIIKKVMEGQKKRN